LKAIFVYLDKKGGGSASVEARRSRSTYS